MGMTEYEDEPVEGLPEHLPEGETMVWQGRPTAAAMGKRVFYIRHLTLYFGLLIHILDLLLLLMHTDLFLIQEMKEQSKD